jgi:hypothetical protein
MTKKIIKKARSELLMAVVRAIIIHCAQKIAIGKNLCLLT